MAWFCVSFSVDTMPFAAYIGGMETTRIIKALQRVNAQQLARLSGVGLRTIFRLRDGQGSPRLSTLERLAPHIKRATRKDTP